MSCLFSTREFLKWLLLALWAIFLCRTEHHQTPTSPSHTHGNSLLELNFPVPAAKCWDFNSKLHLAKAPAFVQLQGCTGEEAQTIVNLWLCWTHFLYLLSGAPPSPSFSTRCSLADICHLVLSRPLCPGHVPQQAEHFCPYQAVMHPTPSEDVERGPETVCRSSEPDATSQLFHNLHSFSTLCHSSTLGLLTVTLQVAIKEK